MEKVYKVVRGIKLYQRLCSQCKTIEFWVPKSSKQQTCGQFCELKRRNSNLTLLKKSGPFKDKIKRSDYED